MLSDFDLHLMGEGRHYEAYRRMGAQLRTVGDVPGVNFAVWAPNAVGVSVIGDFNGWDGHRHLMTKRQASGVWELFVPQLPTGQKYKFRVAHSQGFTDKSDPYGFAAEQPPRTASIVTDLSYEWNDAGWLERRGRENPLEQPISIYEVHLGSWQRFGAGPCDWLDYRALAKDLVEYCQRMNYTHIELLPITEHPYTGSWGYQTVGYFAPTSRYGTPEDFMYFVDYCHRHDIGVILDWVPAHFPKDDHGLAKFDGTALFEHADPRQGEHPDWGTLIFNYCRSEVRSFLLSNALFWFDRYHIDGIRVDAVASMLYLDYSREPGEWIPNERGGRENTAAISLLQELNEQVHERHPGVLTIAEESTAWRGVSESTASGGLGFSLKWNMGWMNDTREYFKKDPVYRRHHHDDLTFSMIYAFSENFALPLSHDEIVHGKGSLLEQMSGDTWQKFANLRLLYSYQWTHPGKKLLFMGCDLGQRWEWNCDEGIPWHLVKQPEHAGIQQLVSDLNRLLLCEPALHEVDFQPAGFEWIDCLNYEQSVLAYVRRAQNMEDFLVVAANFTPVTRLNYRVGVPRRGWYRELLNSDAVRYGGSNALNENGCVADPIEAQGRELSVSITLPPLGLVVLKPE